MHKTLLEAITDYLNLPGTQGGFVQGFTAKRSNSDVPRLDDNDEIEVLVYPGNRQVVVDTRSDSSRTYQAYVAIFKRVEVDDETDEAERLAAEDELIQLAEEIENALISQRVIDGFGLLGTFQIVTPPFFTDDLQKNNVFASLVPLQYVKMIPAAWP